MGVLQKTSLIAIIILHTVTYSVQEGYLQTGQCEPIRIPMCQSMPWNETKMPNLMDQTSQQNAMLKIEEYAPLVNCSEKFPFFLCSMFAPICWSAHDVPQIKPCREVCQQVRSECEPVILSRYNRAWPAEIDCDSFPKYNEGVCISPEAIQRQSNTTVAPVTLSTTTQKACDCKKKTRFHIRRYIQGQLQMVLRVKVITSKQIGKLYLTQINVIKILKNEAPNFSLDEGNTLMFWTKRKSCRGQICPDVRERKEYILACNRIQKGGRLIFDPEVCMISRWKDKWIQTIANWERVAKLPKSSRKAELRNIRHSKKNKKRGKKDTEQEDAS